MFVVMPEQCSVSKKTSIGGQALIEGVMMRGPEMTAMAVRHVSGEIVIEKWATEGTNKPKFLKLPFVRGIFNMIDSMRYGYKCLMRSAELAGLEDEEDAPSKKAAECRETVTAAVSDTVEATVQSERTEDSLHIEQTVQPDESAVQEEVANAVATAESQPEKDTATPDAPKDKKKKREEMFMTVLMVFSSMLGVLLAIVLFMWLPAQLSKWMEKVVPAMSNYALKSIFEGVIRIVLFVGYVSLVSLMKDIRRVFMYHGAEHKTIFCYEKGMELTVENVREQSRFHPRCGTSFLVLMLLVGIFVSMLIPISNPVPRACVKLLTLPIVVGIGYELIKLAGRKNNAFTRIISKPGMWVQHITTKEPDDSMIECAIAAFKPVIPQDSEADQW